MKLDFDRKTFAGVDELLKQRTDTTPLPRTIFKTLEAGAYDDSEVLGTSRNKPILTAPHPYRWMGLSPDAGLMLWVAFGGPPDAGRDMFVLNPGAWLPIAGQEVYIATDLTTYRFQASDRRMLHLCFTGEPVAPSSMVPQGPSVSVGGMVSRNNVPLAATVPTLGTQGVPIPPGVDHVLVHVHDNASGVPIVGAETADLDVYWWNEENDIWAHHPDDDFDAAGRGAAVRSHDAEIYSIPGGFSRIVLNNTAGNTLWYDCTFFKKAP